MAAKIVELEQRVKRLEEAVLALATGQPIGRTVDGLVVAAPRPQPIYTGRTGHDFVG